MSGSAYAVCPEELGENACHVCGEDYCPECGGCAADPRPHCHSCDCDGELELAYDEDGAGYSLTAIERIVRAQQGFDRDCAERTERLRANLRRGAA